MDSPGTLELLLRSGPGRVMFGSDSPAYYFESPLLMAEYADLTDEQKEGYLRGNALGFLGEERG